jgi:hypothetical protein
MPSNWKIGDWIILENWYKKRDRIPLKIVDISERKTDKSIVIDVIALERGQRVSVSTEFFRIATELEIKKELVRNTFINKK